MAVGVGEEDYPDVHVVMRSEKKKHGTFVFVVKDRDKRNRVGCCL